jgi:hypothetical protein
MRIGSWKVEYAEGASKNAQRLARIRQAAAHLWVLTETHDSLVLADDYHALTIEPRPDCVSEPLGAGGALVEPWDGTTSDGVRLSDHSALVVELALPRR